MCSCTHPDPRDQLGYAESALFGFRMLLAELPPDADIPVRFLQPMVSLIHEALEPAVKQMENYVPRDAA